jgi:succinylarginine dihydrolase
MSAEANFDGIVGPTHNYAGLSFGNVASERNEGRVSQPKRAALQGLAKMKFLRGLGLVQGVLPPHERPHLPTLRALGFAGDDRAVLARVAKEEPHLLRLVSSSSAMWAANAATVTPSADARDGRLHFTPANLVTTFHRSIEAATTGAALARIFADERRFAVHEPLPRASHFADEGAANHTRLEANGKSLELFVYGRAAFGGSVEPKRYPARQTLEASRAIARRHGVASAMFLQQHPDAIDLGVFHNDVISVGHRHLFLTHEDAFLDPNALSDLSRALPGLEIVRVSRAETPVADAVQSYLFNSQIVTVAGGTMALIAPLEARENEASRRALDRLVADENPIAAVHYLDVRESMRNGGGPACLRLRVVLTPEEHAAVNPRALVDEARFSELTDWVERNYREELAPDDLGDPALLDESRRALDELTALLGLGSIYSFQKSS